MTRDFLGYIMNRPKEKMTRAEFPISSLKDDEVLVKIAGCGVCHTDIGFFDGDVVTKMPPPLILGHEISGTVVDAGEKYTSLKNKNVLIPAVIPCGNCELCDQGLGNICRKQRMPGNDFHGGFASHIRVPGHFLQIVQGDLGKHTLADLAVIADAVTTPYQSMLNAKVCKGDFVVIIGTGGIGTYGVQIAASLGAQVVAIDVDDEKLERITKFGASAVFNAKSLEPREIKRTLAKEAPSPHCWKIFEMSGTLAGQKLAYSLLTFGGTLAIVGFTMEKGEFRLSNLMAFGAQAFGNWGCLPKYYKDVLGLVLKGAIQIKPFVKHYPMSEINEIFQKSHDGVLKERPILIPDFKN